MQPRHAPIVLSLAAAAWSWLASATAADTADRQLPNLPAPDGPRFAITDRVWPQAVGEAHVCLWRDDKLAAVSITIDDNCAPDHAFWLDLGERTGYRFTWFVITGAVEQEGPFFGNWDGFRALLDAGHDVQSHTVTHLNPKRGFSGDVEADYRDSAIQLDEELGADPARVIAYPGGSNRDLNDPALAAPYYAAGRGVQGTINRVNATDYLNTASVGGLKISEPRWANLAGLLDPDSRLYRGWYSTHYHLVKDESRPNLLEGIDWLEENADDIWVGRWKDVALYGQQRDTAQLDTLETTPSRIRLSLTDRMDDTRFNVPLTVKVRVPDAWSSVTLTQAEGQTPLDVIAHGGGSFVLAPIVPDAGEAILEPGDD